MSNNKYKLIKLENINNKESNILKIIHKKSKIFEIKEIYLNKIHKSKDWIYHKHNKILFFPIYGNFKIRVFSKNKNIDINLSIKKNNFNYQSKNLV